VDWGKQPVGPKIEVEAGPFRELLVRIWSCCMRTLSVIALITSLATGAYAENTKKTHRRGAVSLSPIHLAISVVEIQAEVYLTPSLSAAVIFGTGDIPPALPKKFLPELSEDIGVTEYRAQIRYFYYGSSESGAYLGAQAMHLALETQSQNIDVDGSGPGFGVLAGYKWDWSGFVLDLNVGTATMDLEGEAEGEVGNMEVDAEGAKSFTMPTVNANLGWAF